MKSKSIFPYPLAVLAICLWLILLNVPLALAQVNYVPLAPIDVEGSEFTSPSYTYPGDTRADKTCTAPTCFPRYLRTIYNIGIALAGFFAVFSIVRGGFELLFTDSILGHTEAKGIILRAIGGLVVVYGSYILLNAINPQLARDLSLNFQTLKPPEALFTRPPFNREELENAMQSKYDAAISARSRKDRDAAIKLDAVAQDYEQSALDAIEVGDEASAQFFTAKANEARIKSIAAHTEDVINRTRDRGLQAAQIGEIGIFSGIEDQNIQKARQEIENIDKFSSAQISTLNSKGAVTEAATLYEQRNRSTGEIRKNIAERMIVATRYDEAKILASQIEADAIRALASLEIIKRGLSGADRDIIDTKINCVKGNTQRSIAGINNAGTDKRGFTPYQPTMVILPGLCTSQ